MTCEERGDNESVVVWSMLSLFTVQLGCRQDTTDLPSLPPGLSTMEEGSFFFNGFVLRKFGAKATLIKYF